MSEKEEQWLSNYFSALGGEISTAMSTINSNQSWTITIVSAINSGVILRGFTSDIWTWILLIFGLSLTIRFFVRSCLAYTNLIRWNTIRKKINKLKLDSSDKEIKIRDLMNAIDKYDFQWFSPISKIGLIKANLKYGYYYSFTSILALIFYNIFSVYKETKFSNPDAHQILGVGVLGLSVILWEIKIFFDSQYFKHVPLTEVEKENFNFRRFLSDYKFVFLFLIMFGGVSLLMYTESETLILSKHDFDIKIDNYFFYNNITYKKNTKLVVKWISSDKIGLGLSNINNFYEYNQTKTSLKYEKYDYNENSQIKHHVGNDETMSLFLFTSNFNDLFIQIYIIETRTPLLIYGTWTTIIIMIIITLLILQHLTRNK